MIVRKPNEQNSQSERAYTRAIGRKIKTGVKLIGFSSNSLSSRPPLPPLPLNVKTVDSAKWLTLWKPREMGNTSAIWTNTFFFLSFSLYIYIYIFFSSLFLTLIVQSGLERLLSKKDTKWWEGAKMYSVENFSCQPRHSLSCFTTIN